MKRTVFFISDSTGITAKTLGQSLLSQFEDIEFNRVMLPYIDTRERAEDAVTQINRVREKEGTRPIIFDTVIDRDIRTIIAGSQGFMVDIFSTFLSPLEQELKAQSSYSVGKSHNVSTQDRQYRDRINAVHFAMDNDDGLRVRHYDDADIILIGVSRSGKTPTCLYLALQFGVYAANYPLTEDDLSDMDLPRVLKPYRDRLFGLTIEPQRLSAIRHERKADSRYASPRQCDLEVRDAEALFRRYRIPFIDTTHYSIEEISTRIIMETDIPGVR